MDSMATALQKFGYSNGFRRGTFDSVNLIIYSMLAVIPFFDRNSAYLFSSYMFLFTALFELPTGISSDKYGANKSLLLGYWIIILGVIYLGYVSLSTNQEYIVADISIIISCGVIALGAAFCNGSFQSAYLQWFYNLSPKLERDSSNYLFSKSYKFGYKVEILLPVLCLLFGTIITNCLFEEETLENYYNFTVFMFSLLVFLLVFSYFIVNKDIKFNESYVQGSSVGRCFKFNLIGWRLMSLYLFLNLVLYISFFYMGISLYEDIKGEGSDVWKFGLSLNVFISSCISFTTKLLSEVSFSKSTNVFKIVLFSVFIISISYFLMVFFVSHGLLNIVFKVFVMISLSALAMFGMNLISSIVSNYVFDNVSSWFSLVSLLTALIYSSLTSLVFVEFGSLISIKLTYFSISMVSIIFFITFSSFFKVKDYEYS